MTDALRIRRIHAGDRDCRPLVCLHGFLGSSSDWQGVGGDIGRTTGRSVLAIDLPGHGASVGLPDPAYTFDGATAAIRDAIFESGNAPVVLVGYSMGARLALATACRAPGLVSALVIESGHPGIEGSTERAVRLEHDRRTADDLLREWPDFLGSWYRQPVFDGIPEALVNSWIERRSSQDPAELARALVGLSTGRQEPLAGRLEGLDLPQLYIVGEKDRKYVEIGRSLMAGSERMQFCAVEDAGHNVHEERPDAYLRALETFLKPIA